MTSVPFFFFIHNRNHVRILVPVAERLRAQGHAVCLVDMEAWQRQEGAIPELHKRGASSLSIADLAMAPPSRAVFIMGVDWSPGPFVKFLRRVNRRTLAHPFRRRSIRRVAVVDGCRFALPGRYKNVDCVLAWGPSGRDCFRQTVMVTGSPIIEAAKARPAAAGAAPLVAVNHKFTYDHMEDAAWWTEAVTRACAAVGVPCAFSAHPLNRVMPDQPDEDIGSLLDRASVLVTRPSTVAYEAMVRGIPVVLFPVPGEELAEFGEPMGAFAIASAETLPALIASALQAKAGYAARCRQFLEHHVALDEKESAGARIAAALTAIAAEL